MQRLLVGRGEGALVRLELLQRVLPPQHGLRRAPPQINGLCNACVGGGGGAVVAAGMFSCDQEGGRASGWAGPSPALEFFSRKMEGHPPGPPPPNQVTIVGENKTLG